MHLRFVFDSQRRDMGVSDYIMAAAWGIKDLSKEGQMIETGVNWYDMRK